jgi:hypothetical protein
MPPPWVRFEWEPVLNQERIKAPLMPSIGLLL